MSLDMGTFRIDVEIENPLLPGARKLVPSVLIDTGAAFLYVLGTTATDDVVFGEPGDLTLLGARSLEGLNLRIDPVSRRLIDAGPAPAAAAA